MMVRKFLAGPLGTNCYLVVNDKTGEAVIVDPASCPERLKDCVSQEGLQVRAILLTHAHFDHIMGIDDVMAVFGQMPVYVHEADRQMLESGRLNMSWDYGMNYSYRGAVSVWDGQRLSLIGTEFQVIHTPGHTPGSVCYYVEPEEVLISGDTLFRESVGRTDFPGGSSSDLVRSVREKLFVLPENTQVYPGHMGTTTIWHEKGHNPFVY